MNSPIEKLKYRVDDVMVPIYRHHSFIHTPSRTGLIALLAHPDHISVEPEFIDDNRDPLIYLYAWSDGRNAQLVNLFNESVAHLRGPFLELMDAVGYQTVISRDAEGEEGIRKVGFLYLFPEQIMGHACPYSLGELAEHQDIQEVREI